MYNDIPCFSTFFTFCTSTVWRWTGDSSKSSEVDWSLSLTCLKVSQKSWQTQNPWRFWRVNLSHLCPHSIGACGEIRRAGHLMMYIPILNKWRKTTSSPLAISRLPNSLDVSMSRFVHRGSPRGWGDWTNSSIIMNMIHTIQNWYIIVASICMMDVALAASAARFHIYIVLARNN